MTNIFGNLDADHLKVEESKISVLISIIFSKLCFKLNILLLHKSITHLPWSKRLTAQTNFSFISQCPVVKNGSFKTTSLLLIFMKHPMTNFYTAQKVINTNND